jgi:serine/threonine-protein kinase
VPDHEARPPTLPALLADRYVLDERLADGGSAEVWRGQDEVLGRAVAVKVLHRHLLTDEATRERLIREAKAAASLSHPGIVAVYDVAADDDGAALVLELVEGESVAARLRREGILPPREAARIGAEVAEALAHAHERGVVHRDVKASNVLLESDGTARLADFGIARLLDDAQAGLTAEGTVVGTLHALAPEQLRGETAGPPADVYAVGVLVAEMVSGEPPFPGDTALAVAEAQQIPPMAIANAPPDLAAIIRAALEPDPADRPASAEELARQLRQWLIDDAEPQSRTAVANDAPTQPAVPLPVPVPTAIREPVPAVPEPLPPPLEPASESREDRSGDGGRPAWLYALAALIVAGILLLALGLANGSPRPIAEKSSPTPTISQAPTPSATPAVTPAPPASLAEALTAFDAVIADGLASGQISEDAADRLREAAGKIGEEGEDENPGHLNRAVRDLRREISQLAGDGEISPDAAAELDAAAGDIEATLG